MSDLGERLVMVLGIWSTPEAATVIDRELEVSDKLSPSFCSGEEEEISTSELPESSVSSTSRGG